MEERKQRKHERVRLALNVNWGLTAACSNDGRMTSLGMGGCFIQMKDKLLIDQIIFIRLPLTTAERILQGRVRYTLLDAGAGIEFIGLIGDASAAVAELIDHARS